jgi:hypothetical protein
VIVVFPDVAVAATVKVVVPAGVPAFFGGLGMELLLPQPVNGSVTAQKSRRSRVRFLLRRGKPKSRRAAIEHLAKKGKLPGLV